MQILFLQVKKVQCTKCPLEDLCSYLGNCPSSVGNEQANDMPRKAANERPTHPACGLAKPGTSWNQGQLWGRQRDLIGFSLQSIQQTSINPQKTLSRRTLSLLRMWKLSGTAGSWREGSREKRECRAPSPDLVLRRESSCWEKNWTSRIGAKKEVAEKLLFWSLPLQVPPALSQRRLSRAPGSEFWAQLPMHQAQSQRKVATHWTWAQNPFLDQMTIRLWRKRKRTLDPFPQPEPVGVHAPHPSRNRERELVYMHKGCTPSSWSGHPQSAHPEVPTVHTWEVHGLHLFHSKHHTLSHYTLIRTSMLGSETPGINVDYWSNTVKTSHNLFTRRQCNTLTYQFLHWMSSACILLKILELFSLPHTMCYLHH